MRKSIALPLILTLGFLGALGQSAFAIDVPTAPKNCDKMDLKKCHQRVQEAFDLKRNYGYSPSNTKLSTAVFEPACKKGDALACALTAEETRGSGGKPEVYSKIFSRKYFAKLAKECEAKDKYSCDMQGFALSIGLGAPADLANGEKFFQKSCELGLGAGCLNAAVAYQKGLGVERSDQKFEEFLGKGCDLGDGISCLKLAAIYQNGFQSISKAPDKAFQTFVKGCDHGYAPACDMAAFFSNRQNDEASAKEFRGKACKLGYSTDCRAN